MLPITFFFRISADVIPNSICCSNKSSTPIKKCLETIIQVTNKVLIVFLLKEILLDTSTFSISASFKKSGLSWWYQNHIYLNQNLIFIYFVS